MNRCPRRHSQWNLFGYWYSRWHGLLCPECRRWRRADQKIAEGFRALRHAPLPVNLEAQILQSAGLGQPDLEIRPRSSPPWRMLADWLRFVTVERSFRVGMAIFALVFAFGGLEWADRMKDARVAEALRGLEAREQRLREISITYDWRLVHRVTPEGNSTAGGGQSQGKIGEVEIHRVRFTWAHKGQKMLLDQSDEFSRGKPLSRTHYTFDGERILARYYRLPPDKRPPKEEVADSKSLLENIRHGAAEVGLWCVNRPISELLKTRARVKCLGYERIGADRCLALEIDDPVTDPDQTYGRARLWLDVQHGYLLRRVWQYDTRDRQTLGGEMVATEPREWAPGLFLATRITSWNYNVIQGGDVLGGRYTTAPTIVRTVTVRRVILRGLPDHLFR